MNGSLMQDVRHAVRLLAKRRGFTATAVLTLAIGIGANTAIFSAVRAIFLRPLPYPQSERLVHIWSTWSGGAGNFSYPDYTAMVEESRSFDAVAAYEPWGSLSLTGGERPVLLNPNFVTPSYLELLGARTVLGRVFREDENTTPGAHPVAVISHGLWQGEFGSDPGVIGRVVTLNRIAYTVVGVVDQAFADLSRVEGSEAADVWLPTTMAQTTLGQPPLTDAYRIYWGLGRLKPGVTLAQAQDDIASLARRMEERRPATHKGYRLNAQPLAQRVRGALGGPTLLLMGGAAFILLIVCANVANLLLARMMERRREFAMRTALGATAGRLLRQLLVECGVLAAVGGGAGLLLAAWTIQSLGVWIQENVSPFVEVGVDGAALACSLGLSVVTALLFGLAPALEATRVDLREAINPGQRQEGSTGRAGLRKALVVAEVAFSLMLLVGAGLMARSFTTLTSTGLGFRTDNLLTFRLDLAGAAYAQPATRVRFAQAFVEKAEAVPGVESATLWGPSMLANATWVMSVLPEGRNADRPDAFTMVFRHSVNPGGMENLGISLLRGRDFSRDDTERTPEVAIVSQSVADQFWPGEDPVGKRLRRSNPDLPLFTVVGVAADARHRQRYSLLDIAEGSAPVGRGPQRDVYLPYAQRPNADMTVAVRVAGAPAGVAAALRGVVASLDADLPLHDVRLLDDRVRDQEAAPAAIALLMTGYAAVALLLAVIGIYGVLAQNVRQRTCEIGIRMALGAQRGDVLGLVFRQGLAMTGLGLLAGLGGAFALAHLMRSLLFDVAPTDPVTFVAVPFVLLGVAAAAVYVPARRATQVDPLVSLRYE